MLLVKTKLAQSPIHGIGLFANEFIPQGTPIWKFQPDFDLVIDPKEIPNFPEGVQAQILKYNYFSKDKQKYILCADDARFINHSKTPTAIDGDTESDGETIDIAARDIDVGEEITVDYEAFDGDLSKLSQ